MKKKQVRLSSRGRGEESFIRVKPRPKIKAFIRRVMGHLLDHQTAVVEHMKSYRGLVVYHGLGTGKTLTAIGTVTALEKPAIVVVPAALITNFEEEIKKSGTKASLFQVISSTKFRTQPVDGRGKILIVDEAHELRNEEGETSKMVKQCAYQADKVLLLTGTPIVNGPWDIAPLLNMVIGKTAIPEGRKQFVAKFGNDGLLVPKVWEFVLPCRWSVYLPPPSPDFPFINPIQDVVIPMSPGQLEVYNAWENNKLTLTMIQALTDKYKDVNKFSTLFSDLPQFRAYLDGGRRICNMAELKGQRFHPKFDQALEIIKHTTGKCVVFSQFIRNGIDIMEDLLKQNNITYSRFTGQESQAQKDEAVKLYNTNQVKVFLFSGAGGQGLSLFNTEVALLMEPHWNMAKTQQAIGRVARYKSHTGKNRTITIYKFYCAKPELSSLLGWWGDNTRSRKPVLKQSADMYLWELSKQKEENNKKFLTHSLKYAIEVLECKEIVEKLVNQTLHHEASQE